MKLYAVRQN